METPTPRAAEVTLPRLRTDLLSKYIHLLIRFCREKPLGGFGIAMLFILVMSAILAPWISPYDPKEPFVDAVFAGPSSTYWLGNDQVGRDMLSRLFWGGRVSLYVGLVTVLIGITAGSMLGVTTAYIGGKFDLIAQRFVDAFIAFPGIILALALLAALGSSVNNVILALVILFIPGSSRIVRSQALAIKEMDYVLAARAIGANHLRIVFLYVVPNCFAVFMIYATISVGFAILVESSLSFLGLGVPPETPTWGKMLSEAGRTDIQSTPWQSIFPGAAICITVFAVNFLGDALRDTLDPRLRGTH